ncbi:MAG TPA: RecX family transcriptional regulator [Euzebyales bacterium]
MGQTVPGSPARRASADRPGPAPLIADDATSTTDDAVRRAFAFVLRSTKARPQTAAELRGKLVAREYDADVVAAAIDRATRLGAIDDAAFADAWVADRGMVRGYSAARLRRELERRQVPDPLIDDALAQLDGRDDLAVASELARERAQKLPTSLPPESVARRLVGFLARRGYPPALARRVAIDVSGLDRRWD